VNEKQIYTHNGLMGNMRNDVVWKGVHQSGWYPSRYGKTKKKATMLEARAVGRDGEKPNERFKTCGKIGILGGDVCRNGNATRFCNAMRK
jgi:hypothetical protein